MSFFRPSCDYRFSCNNRRYSFQRFHSAWIWQLLTFSGVEIMAYPHTRPGENLVASVRFVIGWILRKWSDRSHCRGFNKDIEVLMTLICSLEDWPSVRSLGGWLGRYSPVSLPSSLAICEKAIDFGMKMKTLSRRSRRPNCNRSDRCHWHKSSAEH